MIRAALAGRQPLPRRATLIEAPAKETAPAQGAELRPSYLDCAGGGPAKSQFRFAAPPRPLKSALGQAPEFPDDDPRPPLCLAKQRCRDRFPQAASFEGKSFKSGLRRKFLFAG